MLALLVDHDVPGGLRLGETADPVPAADEVLVEVRAISLNHGELRGAILNHGELLGVAKQSAGYVPGWDAAGVVRSPAASGCGPPVGSRVVTYGPSGAWAQLRAVPVGELAVVPEEVDLGAAATLPVAGVTALRALRRLGFVLGRRVLVTGASGGVGRFAVQLGAAAGAHVIASVGSAERGEGLAGLGAAEVVVGLDGVESGLHGVLDNVGGPQLAQAFALLAEGGSVQLIGAASGEPTVFEPYATVGELRSLQSFLMGAELAGDLAVLVGMLASGRLDPQIGRRLDWTDVARAAESLFARRIAGKAVLDVS
ncbi:zinc-binding dehydrogenase [Herbidospora daliensis]|uniref:zinc-binding dehydrogenase n=1 Tax=Herbidospora daliensis TaxID=295585 RepID=UPI0007860D58|nr:zinc-binding dehydrogenase [Herbidospora daliensis]